MAGRFQQLRLLLWKNGLNVIRQPVWSVILLIWPLVIFIILAVTRSQFPPVLKGACYVAPRNLPSAGFFPFLQTLMCSTDSDCSSSSYLSDTGFQSHATNRSQRRRRDTDDLGSSLPLHLPLERGGLSHLILKRDTFNQSQMLELWDTLLNSTLHPINASNLSFSTLDVFNTTMLADEVTLSVILESVGILKGSFCNFSMTAINSSTLSQSDSLAYVLVRFCSSNNTAPEVLLSAFHQVMVELMLQNPSAVIGSIETAVVALEQLQQDTSLWDLLLGLPDLFLMPTYEEAITNGAERLVLLKQALASVVSRFPQANSSVDVLSPFIDESVDLLGVLRSWRGRDASVSLSNVLMPFNMSQISPEMAKHIEQLKIPLDQLFVLMNKEAFYNFLCMNNTIPDCNTRRSELIYGFISQEKVIMQVLSAAPDVLAYINGSSASQPETLQEQLFLSVANVVQDMFQDMPGWEYLNSFLMKAHSSMQIARAAMESQLAYIVPMLQKAENLQTLRPNQTEVDVWVNGPMDSAVQTVIKALMGNTDCPDPTAPLNWMSAFSSMNPELYAILLCPGNSSHLGDVSALEVKVNQLTSVIEGTLVYNVTPSMILTEWHRLYNTSLQYGASYQSLFSEINQAFLSEWMSYNTPLYWFKILLTRGLEAFGEMGPVLQNSSQWVSMEPHLQMAYWILTYRPNATAPSNCSLASNGTFYLTGFTWENFIPLVQSLLMEVSINPAALLRPIEGAQALLQCLYRDNFMDLLHEFLKGSGQPSNAELQQDLFLNLTHLLDHNIQALMNITSNDQFTVQFDDILMNTLNDLVESFGMRELDEQWSESTQNNDLNTLIMNMVQLLNPDSNQTINNENPFAVLDAFFLGLRDILSPQLHVQLEDLQNTTLALFRNLEACSSTGQACLDEVPLVLHTLPVLAGMMRDGADTNVTLTPFQNNMTLPLTCFIIKLLAPSNMSLTEDTICNVLQLLMPLSMFPNVSVLNIQEALQDLNLSVFDLEQVANVSTSPLMSQLLETLNMPQCLNPQPQNTTSPMNHTGSGEAQCTLVFIKRAVDLLQILPLPQGFQSVLSSCLDQVYENVMRFWNMSITESDPLIVTEKVLTEALEIIRENLENLTMENATFITNELSILEGLLNVTLLQLYPYHTINSTLISQPFYAQKLYGEIALWYLQKLGNATSGSTFREFLYQFIHLAEIQVAINTAQFNFSALVSSQFQYLMDHVKPPIDETDLKLIRNAVMTVLQGQLQVIKIVQVYYDSLGYPMNMSIADDIEAQVMTYLTLTQDWTKNPQITTAIVGILQLSGASENWLHNTLPGNLLLSLLTIVDRTTMLSNITSIDQINSQLLITPFTGILQAFNLGQLTSQWSGSSQTTNLSSVVINALQLLSQESLNVLSSEGPFAVLEALLRELKVLWPPEQHIQLEGLLNYTHALMTDITLCSPAGQNCLTEVPQVFQTLSLLVRIIKEGADVNITITPFQDNMTLPVTGHIFNLLFARNMSSTVDTVSNVLGLLKKLSATLSVNVTSVQEALQLFNLTIFDLEQFEQLKWSSSLPLLFSDIMKASNISQCLNQQLQNTSALSSNKTKCVLKLIEAATGFLQAIPMSNSSQEILSAYLQMLFVYSSPVSTEPSVVTEGVLTSMLADIKWILQDAHVENVTSIVNEIQILEGILHMAFNEQYPFSINSTLMSQSAYALREYNEIVLWYLDKLDYAISGSVTREYLDPYIRLAKVQILVNIGQSDFSSIVSNLIQDLMVNVKPPINETDLNIIYAALATILQGQMDLTKTELAYYESAGFQVNMSIYTDIEARVLNYLNLTQDPQFTKTLAKILQWNNNNVNTTTDVMDFEQLIEALTPLLPAENRASFDVVRQVFQGLDYAMQLGNNGDLQSKNFTGAIVNSFRLFLESTFNGTDPMNQTAVDDLAGALHVFLQLLLNTNMSSSQVQDLMEQAALRAENLISVLAPNSAKFSIAVIDNIMTYINTILQASGPVDKSIEVIMILIEGLQAPLPSNNTAEPYISTVLKMINFTLSSNQGGLNLWANLGNMNLSNLDNITKELGEVMDLVLLDGQALGLPPLFAQAIVKPLPELIQILSGRADQLTFHRLEDTVTALLPSLQGTPSWASLLSTLAIGRDVTTAMVQNAQAQTNLINSVTKLLTDVYTGLKPTNVSAIIGVLPGVVQSTIAAVLQARARGSGLNCSVVQKLWDPISQSAGLNSTLFKDWCNENILPFLDAYAISHYQPVTQNMTDKGPQWVNATLAEIVLSLESLYSASLNQSLAMQRFSQVLMEDASGHFNMSPSSGGLTADWSVLFLQDQRAVSTSLLEMALENLEQQVPSSNVTLRPYVLALQKTLDYTLQNAYLHQNATANLQILMQALDVSLTAANISSDNIQRFLSSDIFSKPNELSPDTLMKEVVGKIIDLRLLGNWSEAYGLLEQLLYVKNTSLIFDAVFELVNWYSTNDKTGANFAMDVLPRLYGMVKAVLPAASQVTAPLPCYSDIFINLVGNFLQMLSQFSSTSNFFAPMDKYISPLRMKLTQGQNLVDLMSKAKNSRSGVRREPVDDFLDLLDVDYQMLSQILSVPLSPVELLETMHMFFSNPDLAVFLKGVNGNMAGSSRVNETVDTALNILSDLTLPYNTHNLMGMFMQIGSGGSGLGDLNSIGQLSQIVGRMASMSINLSKQSPLSAAQWLEEVVKELSSAASNVTSHQTNDSSIAILTAINEIMSKNIQQMNNVSFQVESILQNIIASMPASGSKIQLAQYTLTIDQTIGALASFLPIQEAAYINISAQMMKGLTQLVSNPRDMGEMLISTKEIADSLNRILTLSGITTLPNGQYVQNITYPLILSNALATEVLFNLSVSNYTFSGDLERGIVLKQVIDQMTSTLPVEAHVDLQHLKLALMFALSNVTSTSQIRPAFFEISKEVSMYILSSLNVSGNPIAVGSTSGNLAQVLFTVSNQVSEAIYERLLANLPSVQLPDVLSYLREVMLSSSSILPTEEKRYISASLLFIENMSFALNHTRNKGDEGHTVTIISNSFQSLLAAMPNIDTGRSGSIVGDLQRIVKMLLMSDQVSVVQSTDITEQILLTFQNILTELNDSSELDLVRTILEAAGMNAGSLLATNDTNWADKLPLVLTNLADNLPDDFQFGPLNKTIIRGLANESQENLNQLLQTIGTAFELLSTSWTNDSFSFILEKMQIQVCRLEGIESVQHLSQALFFSPGLLCHLVLPTTRALHDIAINMLNKSSSLYEQLLQDFFGDFTTYNTNIDWNTALSNVLGISVDAFGITQVNMTSSSELKLSDLLKNKTLFVKDVMQYTSIPPDVLDTILLYPLPSSNLQILAWAAKLYHCHEPSSLNTTEEMIFKTFCSLSPQDWYRGAVLLTQHVNLENVVYQLMLSSEIQGLVGIMMQMLKFFTDIMQKLSPALNHLQDYLTSFEDLNLMANPEFRHLVRGKRSTMSSGATFLTISQAMCTGGMLSLFGISNLPTFKSAPSLQEQQTMDDLITKFKIPRDATPFCTSFYLDMVSTTGGAIAWAFLKPMLLGQVLYYPDTPLTRDIISKSNSTLQQFGDLRGYAEEWLQSSTYLIQSAQALKKTMPMLMNSLSNPFIQNFIKKQTNIDVTKMQETLNVFSNVTELLEKNKFIVQQISTLSDLMVNLSSCVNFNRYRGYNSTAELDKKAEMLAQNRELYASILFKVPQDESSSLPPKVDYTIRMHIDNSMRTDRVRNPYWVKAAYMSPLKTQRYNRGFAYLQESIERAIISMQTGRQVQEPAVQVQAFPYPCFYKDEYLNSIAFAFPLVLMMAWMLFVANFVKNLVHERELRLHQYMKMMGVTPFSHFLAWFIESSVFILLTVIILTIILKAGAVLPKTDSILLFLYLCNYGLSVLAFSFLVSTFFDKTNVAGLSGSLIYVICFFPFIVVMCLEESLSFSIKSMLSLFSPTCFSYASQYITRYEKQEEGLQWGNMYVSPVANDTSSFGLLSWLLLMDSVIYFLLGAYIRMVFPGRYGVPAPWYFPVLPSFWADQLGCCPRGPRKVGRGLLFSNMMHDTQHEGKDKSKSGGKGHFHPGGEEDFSELPVGVSLHGLTKTYGSRSAIENLNLSFYESHVTSLLGHNGAGKTTTMSLLTGLFAPTSGSIEVYGKDMQASIDDVRKELGVCMQYDVHFDHLTVEEHLQLYGQIKAPHWTKQELHQQVRKILEETGMYSHRHKRVGTLSGGMKRKLSISIAFIGGSRLVVLDEPTTGVDPCSRRSIWDIILQHKQERTIIMSTHHLDEAEVLSDRIAFLERGGLKCCGSPFYLKDKLSCGYNLTLTEKVQSSGSEEKFNIDKVKAFIHSHLPEAQLKERGVGDVVYSLPAYNSQNAEAYRSLLTGLDKNLDALQLGCYGISDTTLEEVFLQLTRDDLKPAGDKTLCTVSESVPDTVASPDNLSDDLGGPMYCGEKTSLTGSSMVTGLALLMQQVMAMLVKRFHHSRRNWKGLLSQVLLPVFFVVGAMGLGSIKSNLQNFPEMQLSPALYDIGQQYTFFSNQNPNSSYLINTLMSNPGIDSYCTENPDSMVCQKRASPVSDEWTYSGNSTAGLESCTCSDFSQTCPKQKYDPPHKTNPSSQIIYNLTNINVENYLLSTANDFTRVRYGGWSFGGSLPSDLQMDILEVPKNRTLTKVWYNPEGHHTMPAFLNSLNNFILRANLPADKQAQQYAISLTSHPYPGEVEDEDTMVRGLVSIMVALCILTGYSIMTASFVIYEVQEHHTGSKRLQHISGISEVFYWTVNFFYDMALYMVPVLLSVIVIAAFQVPAFTDRQNLGAVTLLLVLFGFASFPWMYLLSSLFKDAEMAFISYVCINLFISLNTIISTAIVYFLGQLIHTDENVFAVYRTMSSAFLVFPQFSFGNGLMELARVDLQRQVLSAFGVDAYKNPFGMDVLGWMLTSLFLQGSLCFALRLLLNRSLLQRVRRLFCWIKWVHVPSVWKEDEDVLAERQRVDSGAAASDLLQVSQLMKVYQHLNRKVRAVKELSFAIPAGECFGLLGVNGAGKTTTFKMLTGDISPSHGSAQVRNWDGRMVDIMDCRAEGINIGYCPQVDALDDLMTGEEHLYFYTRIRGIGKRDTDQVVNYLLKKLELNYHRHITSEHYSCGTRRKLSTAIALIGQPQILLLDEPSSGMDPRSKRYLWKIIAEEVMGKCAVVLTSHSMEECEALCSRLAIMVQGRFRCLGSLQHIKNRFGRGFTVKMYLAGASCDVDAISRFMEQRFPSTYLKDHHLAMVEYHVPVAPGGVADIFDHLESNKAALQIKHFSVCQTTLDEVFINFASENADEDSQDVKL
ncbi:uncharacterized protein abca12 [Brachyhypopomus gauderio]|uniref:uncharacterized protein abca12 n=1 Tax=Brachyhypopomus gauderio TaxID=698409 RepID=UPI00404139D6